MNTYKLDKPIKFKLTTATALLESFSHLVDIIRYPYGKVTRKELLKEDVFDEEDLHNYLEWGVLKVQYGYYYQLTDVGKEFYFKNKEFRER